MRYTLLIPLFLISALFQGCAAPLVIGAAAGGGAVAAHDKRSAGTIVDDEGIELKVLDLIASDQDFGKQTHVNVTSFNGIVLLTGEIPDQKRHRHAASLARKVNKVRQVHNELKVGKPTTFSERSRDTWITTKVKSRLLAADNVDGLRIKVITEAGAVYLMGIVSRQQAKAAIEVARNTTDVKKVIKVFEYAK